VLDHTRHEVHVKARPVDLTATEFRLLALLMERRGRVQGRDSLLNDVWGYESVDRHAAPSTRMSAACAKSSAARLLHRDDPRCGLSHQRRRPVMTPELADVR